MTWEIIHGNCLDVMRGLDSVDCIITDPPYSERTHGGHCAGVAMAQAKGTPGNVEITRRELDYKHWAPDDVAAFADAAAPVSTGWVLALSDDVLCRFYRDSLERLDLTGFQPIPCVMPGMTVRLAGDGPSSWAVYANVARPKALHRWGTLPGAYVGTPGRGPVRAEGWIGGKPLWLMRALVRDYSRPGDTILDPCCGGGTTGVAAIEAGRNFIGADIDPEAVRVSRERCEKAEAQPDLFVASPKPQQLEI
jgi:SAM-dependent methyltransferase